MRCLCRSVSVPWPVPCGVVPVLSGSIPRSHPNPAKSSIDPPKLLHPRNQDNEPDPKNTAPRKFWVAPAPNIGGENPCRLFPHLRLVRIQFPSAPSLLATPPQRGYLSPSLGPLLIPRTPCRVFLTGPLRRQYPGCHRSRCSGSRDVLISLGFSVREHLRWTLSQYSEYGDCMGSWDHRYSRLHKTPRSARHRKVGERLRSLHRYSSSPSAGLLTPFSRHCKETSALSRFQLSCFWQSSSVARDLIRPRLNHA